LSVLTDATLMGSGSGKEDPKRVEGTPDHSTMELKNAVQELELQLHQALQERDALLDHVLEQRGASSVCSRLLRASDIAHVFIQLPLYTVVLTNWHESKSFNNMTEVRRLLSCGSRTSARSVCLKLNLNLQGSGNEMQPKNSTSGPNGQLKEAGECVHCDGSLQRHDNQRQIPAVGVTCQSDTILSRTKSVSQKRRSLSVQPSQTVQPARCNHVNTDSRAQQGNRARTTRGSSLTHVNRGIGFGSVQGAVTCSVEHQFTPWALSLQHI
jgi:hypothetical protein